MNTFKTFKKGLYVYLRDLHYFQTEIMPGLLLASLSLAILGIFKMPGGDHPAVQFLIWLERACDVLWVVLIGYAIYRFMTEFYRSMIELGAADIEKHDDVCDIRKHDNV